MKLNLSLFPPTFWIFSCIVLCLTSYTILWRIRLYKKLKLQLKEVQDHLADQIDSRTNKLRNKQSISLTSKPQLLKELELRYSNACAILEQVNTVALVKQVFKKQKVQNIPYESIEHFCRLVPNLLIASGLMGTFLGIAFNLNQVYQSINSPESTEVQELIRSLQSPLQSIGLAFGSSLLALICSIFLSLLYSKWNTGLIQSRLLILLEDYLDNIYQPSLDGYTRLDKVLAHMDENFNKFLLNFGEIVRKSVENAFSENLTRLTTAHENLAEQAVGMYAAFRESSSTFNSSANTIKASVQEFEETFQKLKPTVGQFVDIVELFSSELTDTQHELSQSVGLLHLATQSNNNSINLIKDTTDKILDLTAEVKQLGQTSGDILRETHHNQINLAEIIPQLKQGIEDFLMAIDMLEQLKSQAESRENQLSNTQSDLQALAMTINTVNQKMESAIHSIHDYSITLDGALKDSKSEVVKALNNNTEKLDTVVQIKKVELKQAKSLDVKQEKITEELRRLQSELLSQKQTNHIFSDELRKLLEKLTSIEDDMLTAINSQGQSHQDYLRLINEGIVKLNKNSIRLNQTQQTFKSTSQNSTQKSLNPPSNQ